MTRRELLPAPWTSLAKATVHPGPPITGPRSTTSLPLASMTLVPSGAPRTRTSFVRATAAEGDPIWLWSWPAEPRAAARLAGRTAVATGRRITFRTARPAGSSLAEARGDADSLLKTDLSFEAIRDATVRPEERVAREAERFGLGSAGGIAEEELMRLAGKVVGDPGTQRHGVEGRPGADRLRHDLRFERPLELDDDRAHPCLRRKRDSLHRRVDDRHPHRRRLHINRAGLAERRGRPNREAGDPAGLGHARDALAGERGRRRVRTGGRTLWHAIDLQPRDAEQMAQGVGETGGQKEPSDQDNRERRRHRRQGTPVQKHTRPPGFRAVFGDPRTHRGPQVALRATQPRTDVREGPLEVAIVESLSHR